VVTPGKGKITYWESITNASSFVPGQTSSGVQGSIPGMLAGETVSEIINAEPAGFILTFSHGRVAHLTTRDQMGRPGIGIQFLRRQNLGNNGLFGSIRNVFGGDRRKGIPIVRAGHSTKGQRDIIVATEDGSLEFWSVNLGVGNSMTQEVSIKEDLLDGLKHNLPDEAPSNFQFKVLDFNIGVSSSQAQGLVQHGDDPGTPVVLLTALSYQRTMTYYIVELIVSANSANSAKVQVVHHVKCYNAPLEENGRWRPKLCLPKPYQTAFILFETAVVLYSVVKVEESPSSQLLMERHALPDPFQDCIKFQDDAIYRILGYAAEDSEGVNKHAACVFAVQGFGNVRITSLAPPGPVDDPEESMITLKSKIEQAVFFGTIRHNPLDLTSTSGQQVSQDEVEEAALDISNEILGSTSKYLPQMMPSLDQQMRLRAKALEDLTLHIQKHYTPLSRAVKWKLLWNAEKLAAAQAMWKVQEEIQKRQPKERDFCIMEYVLTAIHEKNKTKPESAKGEKDRVRHWLIHDPARVEHFLAWLGNAFNELKKEDIAEPSLIADYRCEANDLWVALYDTAFKFREDNAPVYGLGDEVLQDGVLTTGYADLPQFWTSSEEPLQWGQVMVRDTCRFLEKWWNISGSDNGDAPPRKALVHLAQRLPEQVELISRLLTEEAVRMRETSDESGNQTKQSIETKKTTNLRYLIRAISPYNNMPNAIKITEKLGDTSLLVRLNLDYIKQVIDEAQAKPHRTSADLERMEAKVFEIQNHAEIYFDMFGDKWARSHFQRMVYDGDLGAMLAEVQEDEKKQPYLTKYLRGNRKYGKISWINDVVGGRDYLAAAKTLDWVAESQETILWNKRTETCLAKLANLAALEEDGKTLNAPERQNIAPLDNAISIMDIQEALYAHVAPVTRNAIDVTAAHEIALDTFGKRVVGSKPSQRKLLKDGLGTLLQKQVMRPEMLVDTLTLMDPFETELGRDEDPGILGHEFSLALTVVEAMPASGPEASSLKEALQPLIWRRAMIRDDWGVLNETASKSDEQVESAMTHSALFNALLQCAEVGLSSDKPAPRVWSPSEILEADVFPEILQARFRENERERVQIDLEAEQERLRVFVEKGRLQVHFEGLISAARDRVRRDADRAGDEAAQDLAEEAVLTVSGEDDDG
jgi:nuclear pore complex protein Nup133